MFFLLWDASALAQRYAPEIGHQTVNALFTAVSRAQLITTVLSYSETCGALVRKTLARPEHAYLKHDARPQS